MSFMKYHKKEKKFVVNQKSLTNAQAALDKLRPIRDAIEPAVSNIAGFGCILLSKKILIYCHTDVAAKEIKKAIKRSHLKHVDIRPLTPEVPKRSKGRAGIIPTNQTA